MVSILFVLEVVGLFLFHLLAMPMQLLVFVKNYYFWYLISIAVLSLIGAIYVIPINNFRNPGRVLAVFQVTPLSTVCVRVLILQHVCVCVCVCVMDA